MGVYIPNERADPFDGLNVATRDMDKNTSPPTDDAHSTNEPTGGPADTSDDGFYVTWDARGNVLPPTDDAVDGGAPVSGAFSMNGQTIVFWELTDLMGQNDDPSEAATKPKTDDVRPTPGPGSDKTPPHPDVGWTQLYTAVR
jgi:hypothetical protein